MTSGVDEVLKLLLAEGLIEVSPTCRVNLPPMMAALLSGVDWQFWSGEPGDLVVYRLTDLGKKFADAARAGP